jgi:hypothetical protein
MIRTQIQLEENQVAALQKLASERRQSVAQLIRTSVDLFVQREAGAGQADRLERAKSVIGKFSSASPDVSRLHDAHLADAYGGK